MERWVTCKQCRATGYEDRVWRGNTIETAAPLCKACKGRAWVRSTPSEGGK